MKKFYKAIALTLASAFVFGLSACGQAPADAQSAAPSQSTETKTETQAASEEPKTNNDVVTLKWVAVGTGMPLNYDAWQKKINEYLGEKIGVNIDMEVISWGDWDTRRNVIVNTSGDFDILFTNGNTYNADVKTGAFVEITDLLAKTPELNSLIPPSYWDACRVDGKIYAVPTYKDSSQSEFIVWDKELAASLNIDTKSLSSNEDAKALATLEALTPALQAIKDKTGNAAFPLYKTGATYLTYMYDLMNTGMPVVSVRYDDAEAKVVNALEQPDVKGYLKLYHEWYKSGIINSDAATKPEENGYKPVSMAQGWAGAAITTWGPNMAVEAEAYQWGPTIVSNDTVRGSLNCISSSCKNPEKALEFLQLINTDPYVRDSFYYGLEGEDWEYTADKKVHRIKTDWTMAGYTQGTFFAVTPTDDVEFNQWDEVKTLNEGAKPSVLIGFTFDVSKVEDQVANCFTIFERYKGELMTGSVDPETAIPALMTELRAAGYDEIITEAQAQVDAFMASK